MAIRVTHARVEDVGKLGIEAGKGEQQVRQQAQQFESGLQAQADASRIQAAQINAETAIQKSVMDAQNNREMQEFDSFMRAESERRQIAWKTEQVELTQRHDFEMNMQRKDLETQMIAERDMRATAEKDMKKDSLKKARESFDITDQQYKDALLSLDVGTSPARALFGEGGEIGLMQTSTYKSELTKEKAAAEFASPKAVEERRVIAVKKAGTDLVNTATHRLIDTETKKEAEALASNPDASVADIQRANQVIEAKINQGIQAEQISERRFTTPTTQARMRTGGL